MIVCPACGHKNSVGAKFCDQCSTAVPQTVAPAFGSMATLTGETPVTLIERGTLLSGGRYEILEVLGQGGMGAVYKARDRELDRWVAIKVIQPELANSPAIIKRFKQELILSRQVTHRNVVRIFDIGETDGMKFITMEYIDGIDLKTSILKRGKIPPQEAVDIVRHICDALDAAHSEGVIHRDLKPQNIMIDTTHRVVVMDFGIAHSKYLSGGTMSGAVMGTPEYMAPEQAKGEKADIPTDIFALGIIFYEMLIGSVPFKSETALDTMYRRTRERAQPPVELDPSIPVQANNVVMKCLETQPENRYQNVKEILKDLENFDAGKKIGLVEKVRKRVFRPLASVKAIAILAIIVVAILAGVWIKSRLGQGENGAVPPKGMQVLIADFSGSATGLAGTVEPVLGLALEGASFISNFDRVKARSTAKSLQSDMTVFDENAARLVAAREGIDVVISGSIMEAKPGYRISAKAVEGISGKTLALASATASGKGEVPGALTKLASDLRKALGDTASGEKEQADAETISTSSLEALQSYAQAQDMRSASNWEQAIRYYKAALQLDPNLGRAYSGIAAANANLGQTAEAKKYYELALEHLNRMTEREKYRTRSGYYLFTNSDNAIDETKALVAQFPGDTAGRALLSMAYFNRRNFTAAFVEGSKFVEIYPNNVAALNNRALFAMYLGDFETSGREAAKVLEKNPAVVKGYLAAAMSELGQNRPDKAGEYYRKAKTVSTAGASLAASGLADIALFQGRFDEAISILEGGVAADIAANLPGNAADKLATLATVYADVKDTSRAVSAADRALAASQDDSVVFRAALVYIRSRQGARAKPWIDKLGAKLQNDSRAYAKLLEAAILREDGKTVEAVAKITEARAITDMWLVRFELGRADIDKQAFTEASSEFDACFKRRGEATAIFLDDRPTYHLFPDVLYYQARVQEGLKSAGAVDQYKAFLALKQNASKDPLFLDASKRLSQSAGH